MTKINGIDEMIDGGTNLVTDTQRSNNEVSGIGIGMSPS